MGQVMGAAGAASEGLVGFWGLFLEEGDLALGEAVLDFASLLAVDFEDVVVEASLL